MDIIYLGHASFRLKGKTASVVCDPFDSKAVGFKFPSVEADIVTVSHDHNDHNQFSLVKNVRKVVSGPGEYEISGVSIIGISTFHDDKKGSLRGKNTIYVIEIDNLRIAHLGDLGHELSEKILNRMGAIDILMIPVGGEYTIGTAEAAKVSRAIEPTVIIPMHFFAEGINRETFSKLEKIEPFLSDMGLPVENLPKLSIKQSDITEEKKIVVLERMGA
ncbi:MBL fold metallo-hydrolase [Patescibacteria group bacterium]|nr:MBL fold metallo-hydrolase [Patescibacteria group bacterium]